MHGASPPTGAGSSVIASLVRAARLGDRGAAHRLYQMHVAAVFGTCLAFCRGDRETALDLCQESFARALASLDELREPERFSGWLKTIARRCCLRSLEASRAEQAALRRLATEPGPFREQPRDPDGLASRIIQACPDPGQREVAAMFYREPRVPTSEIAERLGISRTAVTTRLHRFRAWARRHALARLAGAIQEQPESPSNHRPAGPPPGRSTS